ncbi:Fibronectin-binding A domain protein [Thermus sp. CCB_US3_UF1]|uniref:Rqc2 family fibronectin-binding protein n=1 Tax=Thermus sp. CCB_US3_UF1 TaxID=1111069 RepID=UPI0002389E92|nr:NFACT family protein [Thermus sp. CCB_US3_UF1]AEV16115.1 Fibronectin-binding A domain protein [Thermus sp. CCB_US3_UF1]
MEGLLIHAVLRELLPELPALNLGLAFPEEGTLAVLLKGRSGRIFNLVLHYRPPSPSLVLEEGTLLGEAKTPFQRQLAARVKGPLKEAEQLKLDRVVFLRFAGEKGFVDTPPTTLVFEATGRNANLLLLDEEGRILGVDRVITQEVNRYRELRPGLPYTPPPPYAKLDPRTLTPEDLQGLLGQPLKAVVRHVDGVGLELMRELARRAGLTPETPLDPPGLERLYQALKGLVEDPRLRTTLSEELRARWAEEEKEALRKPLLEALEREKRTLLARLADYQGALARLEEAAGLRQKADLLLARLKAVPKGAKEVILEGFDGQPVAIPLDPGLTPQENAKKLYERARRLEELAERALDLIPKTEERVRALEAEMARIARADLGELLALTRKPREDKGPRLGLRYTSPSGFPVLVGRNAKENDLLTRLAHSEDLWFHAQGVPGSHVILKAEGKNPPLEDLLFAARLAAYHSKARGEKQVPVDYTRKKHVWRPRKAPPGQVLYTGAKTLFVEGTLPGEGEAG